MLKPRAYFFTHTPDEVAYSFYRESMEKGEDVHFISRIEDADENAVLLVMQHEADLRSLRQLKEKRPKQITGVVDPRGAHLSKYLKNISFFVVDSLEKRDFFLGYGRPVFLYHDVLHLPHQARIHRNDGPIILGYHGNRLHLEAMFPVVTTAIERLAQQRNVEFWAIYNVAHLGEWSWKPKYTQVRHLQWDRARLPEYLSRIDIGVSPNAMMISDPVKIRRKMSIAPKFFHEKDEDYLIRFKVPTNPGRIFVFANASIPVISDVCTSAMRWIEPGVSGEIAHHTGAWYHSLKALSDDPKLRNSYSAALWKKMERPFSPERQNADFSEFLKALERTDPAMRVFDVVPHRELSTSESFSIRFSIRWMRFLDGGRDFIFRLGRKLGFR